MKTKKGLIIALLLFFSSVSSIRAQQKPDTKPVPKDIESIYNAFDSDSEPAVYYRLDFAISELDEDKAVDTRKYSMWVRSGASQSMVAGSDMPYRRPGGPPNAYQYRDIGISINAMVTAGDDSPKLKLKLNISDMLPPESGEEAPISRKITLDSNALLPLGKQTTVGIVEDTGSKHRFQVDVTATKLN